MALFILTFLNGSWKFYLPEELKLLKYGYSDALGLASTNPSLMCDNSPERRAFGAC